jgi:hypothetical protein
LINAGNLAPDTLPAMNDSIIDSNKLLDILLYVKYGVKNNSESMPGPS